MSWIKLDDGSFAKQETTEIITLEEINERISNLQKELTLVPEPTPTTGLTGRVLEIVEADNLVNVTSKIAFLSTLLEEEQKKKSELEAL